MTYIIIICLLATGIVPMGFAPSKDPFAARAEGWFCGIFFGIGISVLALTFF